MHGLARLEQSTMNTLHQSFRALVSAALLLVVGLVIGMTIPQANAQDGVTWPVVDRPVAGADGALLDSERVYSTIYANVSPAVVSINVTARSTAAFPGSNETFSTGTGFVIDTEGHIVTNAHVVEGATSIEVNFFDGGLYRGEIVGIDLDSDLAVVKVSRPASEFATVPLGNSDSLFIGQEVVAIGSPFNQPWTLTTGVVSALGRTIDGLGQFQIGSVIQTDAAINPGNSGGPLLNLNGEVVGVNSQIISRTRSNSGIGFAVPSNLVARVATSLIENGRVDYSFLGISGGDVTLGLIEALGLPNNARGVVINTVEARGSAGLAGLRSAGRPIEFQGVTVPSAVDIITAIDGTPITSMASLISYLASDTQPGDTVRMTVVRIARGTLEQIDLNVTLQSRPR